VPSAPPARPAARSSYTNATTCYARRAATGRPTPTLRERYRRHRPNIERVVAQVATWRGRRLKLRYHGTTGNHAWLKGRTAALNLRNLIGRGLTRHNGTWTMATT
jgi:hypothetical protein